MPGPRASAPMPSCWLLLLSLGYCAASRTLSQLDPSSTVPDTSSRNGVEIYTVEPSSDWQDIGYNATVASAYFDLHSHSRHSSNNYNTWMANFFEKVQGPMVIFTDPEMLPNIVSLRQGKPTKIHIYPSLWDLPRLHTHREVYSTSQQDMNPEKAYHIPEMYMIWNSKWEVLNITASMNYYATPYFLWVDAGSFREEEHVVQQWPDPARTHAIFNAHPDRILLGIVSTPSQHLLNEYSQEDGPYAGPDVVEGTFFGGTAEMVHWYVETFYRVHDEDLQRGFFVGKDQNLMNQIAFTHKEKFVLLDTNAASCGVNWFYFQQAFANKQEQMVGCPDPVLLLWDNHAVKSMQTV